MVVGLDLERTFGKIHQQTIVGLAVLGEVERQGNAGTQTMLLPLVNMRQGIR